MSQRSEKLHRQVSQLRADVAELKEHQLTTERFNNALQAVTEEGSTQQLLIERRKAREARETAQEWRRNAVLALILATLTAGVAVAISVRAFAAEEPATPLSAPAVTDDGRLPGDDTPAQEPEEPENELIEAALLARATVLEDVTVTHYDVCQRCCGKTDGITASGMQATPYVTVAVDPSVIPLGADVLVDYGDGDLQYYRADDTGSGVKGSHIDLCVSSHEEALRLGIRTATVYWVNPEEVE